MSRRILIALLVVVLGLSATAWFLANFERTTAKVRVGFQGEARANRYLAAQRLLQRMGIQAQAVKALPELRALPPSATLVLPQARQAIALWPRAELLRWVEQGGHLIVEAEPVHEPDPLLDALGVKRSAIEVPEPGENVEGAVSQTVEIALPQGGSPVTVRMVQSFSVDAETALASFGGDYATTLLLIERGRGLVTVANDLTGITNRFIGEHDHAEFLWRLVQLHPESREVLFFHNPRALSLAGWLRTHAWPALSAGTALLLLWLWRVAPRLGPAQADPERQRRRLLDHLRASGRFLWSSGGGAGLLEAAREACLRRVTRAHPDLLATPEAQREARLVQLFGLEPEQARRLLRAPGSVRMADFLHTIRLYQDIHEKLARRTLSRRPTRRTG